ncbi:hypothetical protein [Tautonia plasticadhaerens]|uniref:Uncharacterized protein n=1 Tax=Tautonia plasticadhaerens TaxID=2527974 RepID=A0A518GUQ5_9BACT|nr:hypothetical protein [Tautonia plasticadhaerens]QDV32314.1 hypothetical protein ElP_01420 [Tautonia plasticadhaerens]
MDTTEDPIAPPQLTDPGPGRTRVEEEAERLYVTVERWACKHMPETDPEEALIRAAAVEHVRYLRCVEADEQALRPRCREAMADWEEKRRHAIRRRAQGLKDDPGGTVAELSESAFGLDWMARHWRTLLGLLQSGRGWRGDDLVTALQLLGRTPRRPHPSDLEGRALWDLAAAACPATVDAAAPPGLTGPAEAAAALRALVADRIARLDALRPDAWDRVEGPDRQAVEASSLVDTSPEGQARHRLRREALRDMTRCLSLIMRLRVERSKMDARHSRSAPPEPASPSLPGRPPASPLPEVPTPRQSPQPTEVVPPAPTTIGQAARASAIAEGASTLPGSTAAELAPPARSARVKFEDAKRLRRSAPGAPRAHDGRTGAPDRRPGSPPLEARRLPDAAATSPRSPDPTRSRPPGDDPSR